MGNSLLGHSTDANKAFIQAEKQALRGRKIAFHFGSHGFSSCSEKANQARNPTRDKFTVNFGSGA